MKKSNIWILALVCSAATLTISTVHAGYPPSWRMYVGMPGLYIAMVAAWLGLVRSMISMFIAAFLINGLVYYALIRFVLALTKLRPQ